MLTVDCCQSHAADDIAGIDMTDSGSSAENLPSKLACSATGGSYFLLKLFTPKEIGRSGAKNIVVVLARKSCACREHGDRIGRCPVGMGVVAADHQTRAADAFDDVR